MKKIAVCFAGQIRTGIEAAANLLNYFGSELDNIDFFINTWTTETATTGETGIIDTVKVPLSIDRIADYIKIYNPKKYTILDQVKYAVDYNKYVSNELPEYYASSVYEVNRLRQEYQRENAVNYHFVVTMRPDIVFYSNRSLAEDLKKVEPYSNKFYYYNFEKNNKKLDDFVWISGIGAMNAMAMFSRNKPKKSLRADILENYREFLRSININPVAINSNEEMVCMPYRYYHVASGMNYDNCIDDFFKNTDSMKIKFKVY